MVVNNIALPYRSMGRKIDYPLDQIVKFCTHYFVTSSIEARQSLISVLRLEESRVTQISNAVIEPAIKLSSEEVRKNHDVDEGVTIVGVVAVLEARKGHSFFIESLEALLAAAPQTRSKIQVWLVGDGSLELTLKDHVFQQGLGDTVQFLGYRHDHLDLVNAMDIVVLPSLRNEDSPLATIEAMALSKPVLASKVAGLSEQVLHGKTGYLVEPGNSADLGRRLEQLIEDKNLRESFGMAGRQRYERHFSPSRFVSQYMDLYRRHL
jgi:glycosyltransferase involved in cell wall biosynthesis